MEEIRIRRSRRVALVALGVGVVGLAAVLAVDFLRRPFVVLLLVMAAVVGLAALIDRRVKLSLSAAGIRYSGWGPAVVPWEEFAGYRWANWRGQPYLQLFPRRPTELIARFSALGRIGHAGAGWIGMPRFAIGTTGLEISEAALADIVSRHLPEQPVALEGRGPPL